LRIFIFKLSNLGILFPTSAFDHLLDDLIKLNPDSPFGIVSLQFSAVGNVANVVADSVLIAQAYFEPIRTELFDPIDAFEHGSRVCTPTPKIVNLPRTWIARKRL
jgi:hypothetical protein